MRRTEGRHVLVGSAEEEHVYRDLVDVAQSVIQQFNGQELGSGATLAMSYARPRRERTEGSSYSERRSGGSGRGGGGHYSNRGYNSRNDGY